MTQLWDRREQRVDYNTAIRLFPPDQQIIVGETSNLSETGVFVSVVRPLSVGTEVVCDLMLPSERLTLRGEVVWVREEGGESFHVGGMGIRFTDLSTLDVTALRRLIVANAGDRQFVSVWFEGMSEPIKTRAVIKDDGIQLSTPLPFLRRNSYVDLALDKTNDQVRPGILEHVTLDANAAVPHLRIEVALAQQAEAEETIERIASPPPQPPAPTAAPPNVVAEADLDELGFRREETGLVADRESDDPLHDPCARSHWSFGDEVEEPASTNPPYDHFWGEAERRRRRMWLWLAAIGMSGITVASMVHTNFWQRVSERLLSWSDNGPVSEPLALRGDRSPLPATEGSKWRKTQAAPVAKGARSSELARPTPLKEPSSKKIVDQSKFEQVRISVEGNAAILRVPFEGPVDGLKQYTLANPAGVAINLPSATAKLALGHHSIKRDGFRAIWVRKRKGGVQVRVFFSHGEKVRRAKIKVGGGEIRVELKR